MPTQATTPGIEPFRLYTPGDLEEITGLHWRRWKRLMDEGDIAFVVTGKQRGRRILGSEVLAWLERKTRGAQEA